MYNFGPGTEMDYSRPLSRPAISSTQIPAAPHNWSDMATAWKIPPYTAQSTLKNDEVLKRNKKSLPLEAKRRQFKNHRRRNHEFLESISITFPKGLRIPDIIGITDVSCLNKDGPEAWHVQDLVYGKNVLIDMSIHTAYVKAICAGQHFIYIENQYFLGSSYNWTNHRDLGEELTFRFHVHMMDLYQNDVGLGKLVQSGHARLPRRDRHVGEDGTRIGFLVWELELDFGLGTLVP
ncbi:hypothetical protein TEA_019355 [Camellia sinensis var. sinensis]|uniref:Uncharacterized protein n=1 Tax=Camellia sinensis var. sinensis TaxID=542762 RepID=A0A4S4EGU6_CAMSN|nr:hypothetical protein TEA_019355 [Camellia sinensis var. sinensis]